MDKAVFYYSQVATMCYCYIGGGKKKQSASPVYSASKKVNDYQ